MMVGHHNAITRDRIGDANASGLWAFQSSDRQVRFNRFGQASVIRTEQNMAVLEFAAIMCLPCKSRMGSSHITK